MFTRILYFSLEFHKYIQILFDDQGSCIYHGHLPETLWVIGTPMVVHVHFSSYFLPFVNVYGECIFCPKMHKNIKLVIPLAWKIPWMEEPGGLQSMGSLRVRHDWATSLSLFTFMHWRRKWQSNSVFLPGESQGQGSLVGCRLWGCTELDMTDASKLMLKNLQARLQQ